jgi:hypothetical protein
MERYLEPATGYLSLIFADSESAFVTSVHPEKAMAMFNWSVDPESAFPVQVHHQTPL